MSRGRRPRRAHPRSRGENAVLWVAMRADGGSSPLTRGKRLERATHPGGHGLIPAHAGKTRSTPAPGTASRAHPRSRGENIKDAVGSVIDWGSSPLTRGKRRVRPSSHSTPGLIPAHAGKTLSSRRRMRSVWAHPRSRGENAAEAPSDGIRSGSSPLTRGKPGSARGTHEARGLIPAHAGKT